jgi:LuxR family transcriptional regulator, quorum-sensing system regulator BjaR1
MKQNELFDVLHAAEDIDRARNFGDVLGTLCTYLHSYGFSASLITHLPPTHDSRWQDHILANCWPMEWYQHYNATGHFRHDPCVAQSRCTADPFLWSEVGRQGLERAAQLVMDEASEFGLRQGICVPVHTPFARPIVVTVSGENVDLAPGARLVVGLLARQAVQSVLRLRSGSHDAFRPILSEREREILRWTAEGKTAWETSVILGLSVSTVRCYLESARHKLCATSNTHAVAKAIKADLLSTIP